MSTAADTAQKPDSVAAECCSLFDAPLATEEAEQIARKLSALSNATRLRALSYVAAQGCEAVCARDLTDVLGISEATISHHLQKLVDAGLLTRERRGRWAHYTVVRDAFTELQAVLDLR